VSPTVAMRSASWASCGAMHLTGDPEGPPLSVPWQEAGLFEALEARFGVDCTLLGERAATASLGRRGQLSCGGRTRLMCARDGWVTLSLARQDDLELMPALLGIEVTGSCDMWERILPEVAVRFADELDERAALLGLGFSVVGAGTGPMTASGHPRTRAHMPLAPLVVDLSALWAGPLCAHLLQLAGAQVIKVEDTSRPDGARRGNREFFDLLNQDKLSVALDFRAPQGRRQLIKLLDAADVVVTSSRARAFDQLDITVEEVLATSRDKVWTAITAYGWSSNRVGYGDDVAAGAGLVAWDLNDGEPRFAGDALADPLCGVEAALLTLDCVDRGGRWFVDASLAGAAAKVRPQESPAATAEMHEGRWFFEGQPIEEPKARTPRSAARPLGSDTEKVLQRLAR